MEHILPRIQQLHAESEAVEERISFIDTQVEELTQFIIHLEALENSSETRMLSSLGKGIFIPTTLADKNLWVDVGAGVLVRKRIPEALAIITHQLKNLGQMRTESQAYLHTLHREFETMIAVLEKEKKALSS